MIRHHWQTGRSARTGIVADSHRALRGPYTGLGTVLRLLVPQAGEDRPELVRHHLTEILSAAPELRGRIDAAPETLTSLAVPEERTRIYPANRTRRLAHGATEFLIRYAGTTPLEITFARVDQADPTDQEFLAILLRRADPGRVHVTVETDGTGLLPELAAALDRYAERLPDGPAPAGGDDRDADQLLRAYVEADGTSTDPAERAAYERADPQLRRALHDARAAALRERDEYSLELGAIPWHLEHGSDPAGAGADALYEAARHCGAMGYYHAVIDYGTRGRALVDPDTQMRLFWLLSTRASSAMVVLGRTTEAEPTYLDLRSRYSDPELQMSTGYALAMLYTRFHPDAIKDHHLARGYINNSIAIASLLPDLEKRAFHSVFQNNGLALIEMRLGRVPAALRLVDEGLRRLDQELPGDKHRLHRSVLVHNRGKAYLALGRLAEALADLSKVIELDPNYADYYFDRADARRRLGDITGAIADCDTAISLSPPFYELYYNRADLRAELGDSAGAISDFGYVVELEPDQLDARVNVISLLLDEGAPQRARGYVEEGLELHPDEPRLLHLRGLLALADGQPGAARESFDRALAADPALVAALASRATLAFDSGDPDTAVRDLTAALDVEPDNPDLLYNRGFVHEAARRWAAAEQDYTRALELPGADRDELLERQARCRTELIGTGGPALEPIPAGQSGPATR
ncbi:tetratricopeptide repeat protein [Actinoplanes sp. N902-109]|uniref:tetratricopeptide repeat protein n=1 Tax=Actinoplanes sp. (strain N902-109) TaxID=649831 RepID=UPI0003294797|nr:tetratricopeptide repeat protein [Actinoplanes sp. N902-109]AGL17014.1 TPR repeat-containing protein [Actinoplanes sp. N902-109]